MTRAGTLIEQLRQSFWVFPALCVLAAVAAAVALPSLDHTITLPDALVSTSDADTARSTLQLIATVAVSVAGVSFSVMVVALVLASQQLSPRVLRNFQRHPLNQAVLGVFLATAAFSLYVLAAVGDDQEKPIPELSIAMAMVLAATSLVLFVVFLHHAVRSLNASAVIRRIAQDGHQAVEGPYPAGAGEAPEDEDAANTRFRERTSILKRVDVRAPRAGYLTSVEARDIVNAATESDGQVEQHVVVGRFAVTGKLLATVWAPDEQAASLGRKVCDSFILDEERMVDDDLAFPLRQLTDVALKGLSPGINDPTTAENAMDSVADTLVRVGLEPPICQLRVDQSGTPRLLAANLSFDELVQLGFEQVRRDGVNRPSFAVRLLELLADLRENGGEVAARSSGISRQAKLIRDAASALADVKADALVVEDSYERLHGPRLENAADGLEALSLSGGGAARTGAAN